MQIASKLLYLSISSRIMMRATAYQMQAWTTFALYVAWGVA